MGCAGCRPAIIIDDARPCGRRATIIVAIFRLLPLSPMRVFVPVLSRNTRLKPTQSGNRVLSMRRARGDLCARLSCSASTEWRRRLSFDARATTTTTTTAVTPSKIAVPPFIVPSRLLRSSIVLIQYPPRHPAPLERGTPQPPDWHCLHCKRPGASEAKQQRKLSPQPKSFFPLPLFFLSASFGQRTRPRARQPPPDSGTVPLSDA